MVKYLFRGRRLDNRQLVYGLPFSYHASNVIEGIETWDGERHPIDPETVGMCSGIPDKNGKPIYEGDIVLAKRLKSHGGRATVGVAVFQNGTFKLKILADEGSPEENDFRMIADLRMEIKKQQHDFYAIENNFIFRGYNLEVIGNVGDNPELLEEAYE